MRYSVAVDNLVFDWNEFQQHTFRVIRDLVLDVNPIIVESVKYGVPFYTLNGLFMYVSPTKEGELYLAFCHGDLMLDADGLFSVSDTKKVRKIEFHQSHVPNWSLIESYVFEAVDINLRQRSFSKNKKPR